MRRAAPAPAALPLAEALAQFRAGDARGAEARAREAGALRRDGLDHRGLSRALAIEAAAARGGWAEGRRWLTAAEHLAHASRRADIANAPRAAPDEPVLLRIPR